jgi:hypothetical protein
MCSTIATSSSLDGGGAGSKLTASSSSPRRRRDRVSGVVAKLKVLDHLVTQLSHGEQLLGWPRRQPGLTRIVRDRKRR